MIGSANDPINVCFQTGTNQPPLTNNRDVNSFIIAKAQIDANLWKLWHSSIDLGPGFRSFFVQEALVSYCSIWLMDLFCSHSVYCIVDVLWGQPIKLIQLASTSELRKNQRNNLLFFKIIPSHFCRASEASKIDCFKN